MRTYEAGTDIDDADVDVDIDIDVNIDVDVYIAVNIVVAADIVVVVVDITVAVGVAVVVLALAQVGRLLQRRPARRRRAGAELIQRVGVSAKLPVPTSVGQTHTGAAWR